MPRLKDSQPVSAAALHRREQRAATSNKVYDILIVKQLTTTILDQFQPEMLVLREGAGLYSKKIGKVFSAVTPNERHRIWWADIAARSSDRTIHWLY